MITRIVIIILGVLGQLLVERFREQGDIIMKEKLLQWLKKLKIVTVTLNHVTELKVKQKHYRNVLVSYLLCVVKLDFLLILTFSKTV